MSKTSAKFLFVLCFLLTFTLAGCTKTIEAQEGVFEAENVLIEVSLVIDRIELNIEKTSLENDLNHTNLFIVNEKSYLLTVEVSINESRRFVENVSVTYYRQTLRIGGRFETEDIYIYGITKQRGNQVYIETSVVWGDKTTEFVMNPKT